MEAYKLHPLALVNISDHYIRFKAQLPPEEEPPRVLGCLLGFQEGNRDLEICNSFELIWTPEEGTGRVIVDAEYLAGQKVRYKTVYPKMEVVGWYSTGQAVDHEHDLAIHKAICDASEAPVYLLFDPFRVGASEGAGLGTRFLGHVERCRVLLHLVDGTQEFVGDAYRTIRHELEEYGAGLLDKTEVVALNKIDALDEETIAERRAELAEAAGKDVHVISGVAGMGVRELTFELERIILEERAREMAEESVEVDEGYQP